LLHPCIIYFIWFSITPLHGLLSCHTSYHQPQPFPHPTFYYQPHATQHVLPSTLCPPPTHILQPTQSLLHVLPPTSRYLNHMLYNPPPQHALLSNQFLPHPTFYRQPYATPPYATSLTPCPQSLSSTLRLHLISYYQPHDSSTLRPIINLTLSPNS